MSVESSSFFHRQLIMPEIGPEGQNKLQKSSVLVIGAGGLGCPALVNLALAGIGKIGIVDGDQVSLSNLHRQFIYTREDIGKNKVDIAKDYIGKRIPSTEVEIFNAYLSPRLSKKLFPKYDFILDCTDNFPSRYLINDAAVYFNKPFVFGGINRFQAQWALFNIQGGPTYRCIFPEEDLSGLIKSCDQQGVVGVIPSILGSLQALEAIKYILDLGKYEFQFHMLDLQNFQDNPIKAKRKYDYSSLEIKEDYGGRCRNRPASTIPFSTWGKSNWLLGKNLIDVREIQEFSEGHFEGARNIPLSILENSIGLLKKDLEYFLYCQTDVRSMTAYSILEHSGFKNISILEGGYKALIKSLTSS